MRTVSDFKKALASNPVKKDNIDERDYRYKAGFETLPAAVDLKPWADEIEDQGPLNSCTGNAGASAMELIYKHDGQELDLSRLFLYYWLRQPYPELRNVDEGAYSRDICKTLYEKGICAEALWPYRADAVNSQPSVDAQNDALDNTVLRYERVEPDFSASSLDKIVYPIKHALSKGYPVLLGFLVTESFFYQTGPWQTQNPLAPSVQSPYVGGHEVVIIGYDDASQRFLIENSWGTNWGDDGFGGIHYQELLGMYMDMWAITNVSHALVWPAVDPIEPVDPVDPIDPQPVPPFPEKDSNGTFIIVVVVLLVLVLAASMSG